MTRKIQSDSERLLYLLTNRAKYGTCYPERMELLEKLAAAVEQHRDVQPEPVKQLLEEIEQLKLST